jgi:hypothetical protein
MPPSDSPVVAELIDDPDVVAARRIRSVREQIAARSPRRLFFDRAARENWGHARRGRRPGGYCRLRSWRTSMGSRNITSTAGIAGLVDFAHPPAPSGSRISGPSQVPAMSGMAEVRARRVRPSTRGCCWTDAHRPSTTSISESTSPSCARSNLPVRSLSSASSRPTTLCDIGNKSFGKSSRSTRSRCGALTT